MDERAARQDIADVLVRYATGIDRRDWTRFRSCFADDCHADYGDVGVWDGIDAITQFMVDAHAGMRHTLHRITNVAIDIEGDGNTATARSYVDALLMLDGEDSGINATGFYDDELVRNDEGWRIARRRFTMVRVQTSAPA
jgi:3-phenylpropionate/cinnamic acid dioxygenase small subunit